MNIKKSILCIGLLFSPVFLSLISAQTKVIDSLKLELIKFTSNDTLKVNLLNEISSKSYVINPVDSRNYAFKALSMSDSLKYLKGSVNATKNLALSYVRVDRNEALKYSQKACNMAKDAGLKRELAESLLVLGNINMSLGDIPQSNDIYRELILLAKELDNKTLLFKARTNLAMNINRSGDIVASLSEYQQIIRECTDENQPVLGTVYFTMANIHKTQGNLDIALDYYYKALDIVTMNKELSLLNSIYVNVAGIQYEQGAYNDAIETLNVVKNSAVERKDSMLMSTYYTNMANINLKVNDTTALEFFQKALDLRKFAYISQVVNNLHGLSGIYISRGEFELAYNYLLEALETSVKVNNKIDESISMLKLAEFYKKKGNYRSALKFANQADALNTNLGFKYNSVGSKYLLSSIYAQIGDFKNAYKFSSDYQKLKDEIINEKEIRKLSMLESSYKFKQERKIYELEEISNLHRIKFLRLEVLLLSVILILFILVIIYITKSYIEKRKRHTQELLIKQEKIEALDKEMTVAKLRLLKRAEQDAMNVKIMEDIVKTSVDSSEQINELINNFKYNNDTTNWKEFELVFSKSQTDFWKKINDFTPALTSNERKLCVFLRLNMSSKDIANITLQSEEAIKKSRQRLRLKLGLDRKDNLTSYIQGL